MWQQRPLILDLKGFLGGFLEKIIKFCGKMIVLCLHEIRVAGSSELMQSGWNLREMEWCW